jgi:hypothetical protein
MHRQVTVRHNEIEAEVDAGIAEVVRETWRAGVTTDESCEGRYEERAGCKQAFVCFPAADAERWLKIVNPDVDLPPEYEIEGIPENKLPPLTRQQEAGLERRRLRTGFSGPRRRRWWFDLLPYDPIDVSVRFTVLVFFPSRDLPDVLERLRKHNAHERASKEQQ